MGSCSGSLPLQVAAGQEGWDLGKESLRMRPHTNSPRDNGKRSNGARFRAPRVRAIKTGTQWLIGSTLASDDAVAFPLAPLKEAMDAPARRRVSRDFPGNLAGPAKAPRPRRQT